MADWPMRLSFTWTQQQQQQQHMQKQKQHRQSLIYLDCQARTIDLICQVSIQQATSTLKLKVLRVMETLLRNLLCLFNPLHLTV